MWCCKVLSINKVEVEVQTGTRSDHRSVQCVQPLYKTEVLAVIVVARLHSPATSNDQYSSHQTCSMAQANISVTILYAREKFNWLWKAAKPSNQLIYFPTEYELVTMPPADGTCHPHQDGVQSLKSSGIGYMWDLQMTWLVCILLHWIGTLEFRGKKTKILRNFFAQFRGQK